jgi:DDE superfamily endonuclease
VFLDESGFMLQPLVRRTWAPRGSRPVLDVWQRHDRLSVIGALSLAPQRRRKNLYFHVQSSNILTPDVLTFVYGLRRQLRRPLTLIWDRWQVHRSAERWLAIHAATWLKIEYLPAYAPELNPVEGVWGHTKSNTLGNYEAIDVFDLDETVNQALADLHHTPRLLQSFFDATQLDTS